MNITINYEASQNAPLNLNYKANADKTSTVMNLDLAQLKYHPDKFLPEKS